MKIIYYSNLPFTDCDFPLIREMQQKGHDVYYFIQIYPYQHRCALLDLKQVYPKDGIFKAIDVYSEFNAYANYLNMDNVYVVNYTQNSGIKPSNILLTYKMVRRFKELNADVVNITWPLQSTRSLLYLLKSKLVLTLHDPFPHSGRSRNKEFEMWRKLTFKFVKRIVVLNDAQKKEFSRLYKCPNDKIYSAKLGLYDCICNVEPVKPKVDNPYILFFGLISRYKGVEYLIEAFNIAQKDLPNYKLVIVGKGNLYFDKNLYEGNDSIIIINDYITVPQLAGWLKYASFAVCPYKDATQSGVVQTGFSMDCPMVVTNVGGLPESVEDGVTGLVVPPCDSMSLSKALVKLGTNEFKLKEMRDNINSIWRIKMGWDKILEMYLKCYKSIR